MLLPFVSVRVIGREHLNRSVTPAAVMVSNHQSAVDAFIFGELWWHNFRVTFKRELLWYPGVGSVMWLAGYLPVRRGDKSSGAALLESCARLLKSGVWVLFFPEGTRKIDVSSGPTGPFKAGAFKLALEADVPLVPLTITGARHIMPLGGFPRLVSGGEVKIIVHPPVPTRGKTVEELMEEVKKIIESGLVAGVDYEERKEGKER